mmetsp:Transcript_30907/g.82025  ORF Transcript_30907/g.82025 Transcript_30907/m.82025 type:complete len:640 (-) Transcript_30907:27-1946(-)
MVTTPGRAPLGQPGGLLDACQNGSAPPPPPGQPPGGQASFLGLRSDFSCAGQPPGGQANFLGLRSDFSFGGGPWAGGSSLPSQQGTSGLLGSESPNAGAPCGLQFGSQAPGTSKAPTFPPLVLQPGVPKQASQDCQSAHQSLTQLLQAGVPQSMPGIPSMRPVAPPVAGHPHGQQQLGLPSFLPRDVMPPSTSSTDLNQGQRTHFTPFAMSASPSMDPMPMQTLGAGSLGATGACSLTGNNFLSMMFPSPASGFSMPSLDTGSQAMATDPHQFNMMGGAFGSAGDSLSAGVPGAPCNLGSAGCQPSGTVGNSLGAVSIATLNGAGLGGHDAACATSGSVLSQATVAPPSGLQSALPLTSLAPSPSTSSAELSFLAAPAPTQPRPLLTVGNPVDAQCLGWGDIWYPGTIRELLPNGEIQVLWDGDEPSISNVPPSCIRARGQEPPTEAQGCDREKVRSNPTLLTSTMSTEPALAAMIAAGIPAVPAPIGSPGLPALPSQPVVAPTATEVGSGHTRSRPREEVPTVTQHMITSPTVVAATSDEPYTYRYDLGPGDDIVGPIGNLRRRVEGELKDGCTVRVTLHIVRPEGVSVQMTPVMTNVARNGVSADGPPPRSGNVAPVAGVLDKQQPLGVKGVPVLSA